MCVYTMVENVPNKSNNIHNRVSVCEHKQVSPLNIILFMCLQKHFWCIWYDARRLTEKENQNKRKISLNRFCFFFIALPLRFAIRFVHILNCDKSARARTRTRIDDLPVKNEKKKKRRRSRRRRRKKTHVKPITVIDVFNSIFLAYSLMVCKY